MTDLGRKGAKKGKGALFRVGNDGRLDQLHALTATYFTSLAVVADGTVYAGAADKGRIYMVDADQSVGTAFDVDERAVSQVWIDHGLVSFATDDAAAMYRSTGRASQARYVSDVLDAKAVSKFGKLTWVVAGQGQGRDAHAATPRSRASAGASGAARRRSASSAAATKAARSRSPPGRYLQFRVALEDDAARRPPRDVVLRAAEHGDAGPGRHGRDRDEGEPADAQGLGGQAAQPGAASVKWKVDNTDSDDTAYTLEARREGEANWRPISTGKAPLTATQWDWNTETYPDGWYKVRVTVVGRGRELARPRADVDLRVDDVRDRQHAPDDRGPDGLVSEGERARERRALDDRRDGVLGRRRQLAARHDGRRPVRRSDRGPAHRSAGRPRAGTHTLAMRVADAAGNVGSVVDDVRDPLARSRAPAESGKCLPRARDA